MPPFKPGQYLTFQLKNVSSGPDRSAVRGAIVRCYSLSDKPDERTYRVTIKRVPSPSNRPDLPAGVASTHFHDRVNVGDVLSVKAPAGNFYINANVDRPAVLIAGGIGVTPMISMLRCCLAEQPGRALHLYYGVRCGADHAFKGQLALLAASNPNFRLNVVYSNPAPSDRAGADYQHTGYINIELLRRTLPHGQHEFYVCGPPAMMESLVPAIVEWGVPVSDVHFEAFGPATVRLPTTEQLVAITNELPDRYKVMVLLGAGAGLRLGEALGLGVEQVEFLPRQLRVERQLLTPSAGEPSFGKPKTPSSVRTVTSSTYG